MVPLVEDRGKIERRNKYGSTMASVQLREGERHQWVVAQSIIFEKQLRMMAVVTKTQDCHFAGAFSIFEEPFPLIEAVQSKRIISLCFIRRFHKLLEVWTSCPDEQRKGKRRAERLFINRLYQNIARAESSQSIVGGGAFSLVLSD